MKMDAFPFSTVDWANVETTEHRGETGTAYWRTRHFGKEPHQSYTRTGAKLFIVD
ncbi:hypothetical protein [Burkholderia ubonensis]|uniref:hypothetical protein n=1 Tax=Burkholderia ubonensis TaxID=101571 RepID=UPI00031213AC|nr:hypothetical protein [Burkholderia ubonensis]